MLTSYTISLPPRILKSEPKAELFPCSKRRARPSAPLPAIASSLQEHAELTVSAAATRRGSADDPRAPENKGDSQPLSSAALSITSTSKAVACAVISTAGNVTTRPTAQTTTSARAMVSGRQRTKPRASEAAAAILRPSSAATSGRRPGPSPPRPKTPPSAAPPGRGGRAPRPPGTRGRGGAGAGAGRPLRGRPLC